MNKNNIVIIIAAFLIVFVPSFVQNVNLRNNQVTACERSNEGIRRPLFKFLTDAKKVRQAQVYTTTGTERQINKEAVRDYSNDISLMVEAVDDVAITPGEPFVDCDEAYPPPFPLSLFE